MQICYANGKNMATEIFPQGYTHQEPYHRVAKLARIDIGRKCKRDNGVGERDKKQQVQKSEETFISSPVGWKPHQLAVGRNALKG